MILFVDDNSLSGIHTISTSRRNSPRITIVVYLMFW